MSQRVAGCCCSPPCDPTLGACCTKVGGVCGCIADKTLCECTRLGGTWSANNLCPVGCWGSCCKYSMSNSFINCTNNVTECDCAAMASPNLTRTTFYRGYTCANNPCSTCLQTHTCQTNRIFNVAVATVIESFSNNYVCACYQDTPKYNTRSGSVETPFQTIFSACQSLQGTGSGFLTWFDDDNIDPSCFNIAEDNTETIITDCDEGGLTGSVTRRIEVKFVMLAQITVPPCGTWIRAGTFKKEMVRMGMGFDCYPLQSGNGIGEFADVTTYCFPNQDWRLGGCNCESLACRNFDTPNPYGNTTKC